ncbi:hypothetical protein BS47DRAFT_1366806 [Hydnum rufescens UP504]|uniref:Fungal-type protein kinase domain-containing protein n=1 Tax=Hydnum rufescens UP504 TaxID=1448309 RepID=A0A9P6AJX1_9AGAM|nr:hypothetical protein BS47DRAFT_1366806 [Hydnum rufescens UP504]
MNFKAKQELDSADQSSKSEDSDSTHFGMPSIFFSATSNVSTGSKRRRSLLASDDMPVKTSRITNNDVKLAKLQRSFHAFESFTHGWYRSRVVPRTVLESMLRFWYYDRVRTVESGNVPFLNNPLDFIQLPISIPNLTDDTWRFRPAIRYSSPTVIRPLRLRAPPKPSHSDNHINSSRDDDTEGNTTTDPDHLEFPIPDLEPPDPFVGTTILVDGQSFILSTHVFRQPVIGRDTCVIDANGGTAIVNPRWPDKVRPLGYEFLDEACNCAQTHVNGESSSVMAHLPELLKSGDLDTTSLLQSWIRHALPQESDTPRETLHVLRATVDNKLLPMTDIRIPDDFKSVMRDVVRCHKWLYDVVGILGRDPDVSLNNIIFYRIDSTIVCILVDFDLEQDITKRSHPMFDRTGIPIFMALDRLKDFPMPHLARHDFESMLWVMVWFTFRYENGRENPHDSSRPLEKWIMNDWDPEDLLVIKSSFFMRRQGNPTLPFKTMYEEWIDPLEYFFFHGYRGRSSYDYQQDDTTVWTAFWQLLNPCDPVDFEDTCNSTRFSFFPINKQI